MRLLLVAALLLPTAAAAGPTLALRAGYAAGIGDASKDVPIADVAKGQVPLQLDALWRFTDRFAGGLYFSYGFGLLGGGVADRCDALGADCSVATLRLGVQGTYQLAPVAGRFLPWVGGGIGYEWVRQSVSTGTFDSSQSVSGWEFLSVQGGADVKVGAKLFVGPYALLSWGRYSSVDGNAVSAKAWHEWLHLGVRGKLDF